MTTRLAALRERLQLTQDELARRAHVSRRTIVSIEGGGRCLHTTKRKILKAIGLDMANAPQVFGGHD